MFDFPDSETLHIYENVKFWDLRAAYDNGILSKDELRSLRKDCTYVHPRHFPDPEAAVEQMVVYVPDRVVPASVKMLTITFGVVITVSGCIVTWFSAKRKK